MCNPVQEILQGVGSLVGAVLGIPKQQSQQQIVQASQPAVQPPPEPQAAKQPEQQAMRSAEAKRQRGFAPSTTMLTGAGGVAPGLLNLGKSTLLGG